MTDDDLVRLATRYFTALDTRDSDALADTLAVNLWDMNGKYADVMPSDEVITALKVMEVGQ